LENGEKVKDIGKDNTSLSELEKAVVGEINV
jgi:hypothetical protein